MFNLTAIRITCAAVALCAMAASAHAQYVWLDAQGVKQFSDMPPPASIPSKNILKAPGGARPSAATAPPEADNAAKPAAGATAASAPLTTAERNADFNKRKALQAEKDRKAAEQVKTDAENAKNCERARDYKRTLDSGDRIGQMDKNGERAFMNDEQRARETKEVNATLATCKS